MKKSTLLWLFAIIFTLSSAYYQRLTGPTNPVRGKVEIAGQEITYRLIRSYPRPADAPVRITVADENVTGSFRYKRTPSHDKWSTAALVREDEQLVAYIPRQPAAGKVQYQITLETDDQQVNLTQAPIVIRFRDDVPAWAMIPHIIFMFAAMLLSLRAGMAAVFKEKTYMLSLLTLITLVVGGLILGPIVQKYAFGAYWTGWPLGTDLTDNKTALAVIFWVVAYIKTRKNTSHRGWVFAAAVVLLLVYLIPHSTMGSEIDFTQETTAIQ